MTRLCMAALAALILGTVARAAHAIPHYDHIVVVIEENQAFQGVIGNVHMPFINSLSYAGALFANAHHNSGRSQPNYLILFSGSDQNMADNAMVPNTPLTTPNLAAQLRDNGKTFTLFADGLPSDGFLGEVFAPDYYDRKHNPAVNWVAANPSGNQIPPSAVRPFSAFPTTPEGYANLPTVAFVIPNECHNMHGEVGCPKDTGIVSADAWLRSNLGGYAQWARMHNSLLIITWDEDDGHSGGRIPIIMYGAGVVPGNYPDRIDHRSELSTIEAAEDLPLLNPNVPPVTVVFSH